MSNQVHGVG